MSNQAEGTIPPKFCKNCGSPLRPGARFCGNCGSPVTARPARVEPPAPAPLPPVEAAKPAVQPATPAPAPEILPPTPAPAAELPAAPPLEIPPPPALPPLAELIPLPEMPPLAIETPPAMQSSPAIPAPEPPVGQAPPVEPPAEAIPAAAETAAAPAAPGEGFQIVLQAIPQGARPRVMGALVLGLGLSSQQAREFADAVPVVLAAGLSAEQAETLKASLERAGAQVELVQPAPVEPPEPPPPPEPLPEPNRRLDLRARVISTPPPRPGFRTVTGLDLGHTNFYLAYCRAEGQKMASPPEMVHFESQTAVPTRLGLRGLVRNPVVGPSVFEDWVKKPDSVQSIDLEKARRTGAVEGSQARAQLRVYLEQFVRRLSTVLDADALSSREGATTTLGVPAAWDEAAGQAVQEVAAQAGFPVSRMVCHPLAALAGAAQLGLLPPAGERQFSLVIDWGGTGLRLSFLEHGGEIAEPLVFEHIEHNFGGRWFDDVIYRRLEAQLPGELAEEDRRALQIFARSFKEQLCKTFAEGKAEHTQYCVIPPEAAPTRVRLTRAEFDQITEAQRQVLSQALLDALEKVGLKPRHLQNVILAGYGARWYFLPDLVRQTLGCEPVIPPRPEELIARGLAVYGLV